MNGCHECTTPSSACPDSDGDPCCDHCNHEPVPATREQMQMMVFRMPMEMHAALKATADSEDRTMAQTLRRALRQYLAGATPNPEEGP